MSFEMAFKSYNHCKCMLSKKLKEVELFQFKKINFDVLRTVKSQLHQKLTDLRNAYNKIADLGHVEPHELAGIELEIESFKKECETEIDKMADDLREYDKGSEMSVKSKSSTKT